MTNATGKAVVVVASASVVVASDRASGTAELVIVAKSVGVAVDTTELVVVYSSVGLAMELMLLNRLHSLDGR